MFRRFRKFIRRHTNPIPVQRAAVWKQRFSLLYMFCAWNAFGFVLYMVYKGKRDWAQDYKSEIDRNLSPAQQWARTLNIDNAKVFRIRGVSSADEVKNLENGQESIDELLTEGRY